MPEHKVRTAPGHGFALTSARISRATLTRQAFRHPQGEGQVCFQPAVDPECPEWPTRPFFSFGADGYLQIYVRARAQRHANLPHQLCVLAGGQR